MENVVLAFLSALAAVVTINHICEILTRPWDKKIDRR